MLAQRVTNTASRWRSWALGALVLPGFQLHGCHSFWDVTLGLQPPKGFNGALLDHSLRSHIWGSYIPMEPQPSPSNIGLKTAGLVWSSGRSWCGWDGADNTKAGVTQGLISGGLHLHGGQMSLERAGSLYWAGVCTGGCPRFVLLC